MKRFTYFLLAALFGLAVTGCDKTPEDTKLDGSKQYISFKIASASNSAYTKASYDGYADGVENEFNVNSVRFYFYQGGTLLKAVDGSFDWKDGSADITKESKEVKCVLEGTTPAEKPDQVLCFLNLQAAAKTALDACGTLDDALLCSNTAADELFFATEVGGTYYFTMSNSVHQNADGSIADAVDVSTHIYDDEDQAKADPVVIYVERVAAKVTAERKTGATDDLTGVEIKDVTGGTDITTCKVSIGSWALNAVNRTAYLTKQIEASTTWPSTEWVPAYDWTADWMGLKNDHRCFWEKDLNYTGVFTDYAEDAADYDGKPATYMLTNYSANELLAHAGKVLNAAYEVVAGTAAPDYGEDDLRERFCLPNTMDQKKGENAADYAADLVSHPKRVGTHLIVIAQVTDGTDPVETFYVYSGNPCTEKLYKTRALNNIFTTTYGKLYADNAGTLLTIDDLKITKADFDTNDYIIEKTAADYTDGYVSVFPETLTKLYYYKAATNEYVEFSVSDSDPVYLATFGKAVVERANKYNKGLMYYAIPIEHANTVTTGEKDPYGKFDRYAIGAYGVVRNHWYQITLGDVEGLGKGIDDPTEPIVPEEDKVWHLAATIKINAWHKLTQESPLK